MKNIAILGSTGSIGTQCLDILADYPEQFKVSALSCGSNVESLKEQAEKFKPKHIAVYSEDAYEKLTEEGLSYPVQIHRGMEGLLYISKLEEVDVVLTSVVGSIGLRPTVEAIKAGKDIALANKETLVTAGSVIMPLAKEKGVHILPVDSEHSALFQALQGNDRKALRRVILTASGGPFRGMKKFELEGVNASDALKHPNWSMGRKISIDSATMMNKGLEVIEAKWLFDVGPEAIDVVVHPQSIIHSMIEYHDSSIMAQMGLPDMKLPIIYALSYPERIETHLESLDFSKMNTLTFETPDLETFPCLALAYEALRIGGTMPTVLNAANEVLVHQYLEGKIGFYDIPKRIDRLMKLHQSIENPTIEDILKVDEQTRRDVLNL
jgi:1-deoxy-D-xylulose-5-phosphate reductoisomerase